MGGGKAGRLGSGGKRGEAGEWDAAWDRVGAALAKVGGELQQARAKARDIDAEIKGLEASRQRPAATTGPARDVTIALDADAATKATVKLTYRIGGAPWLPRRYAPPHPPRPSHKP